jgi:glutamine synthetase
MIETAGESAALAAVSALREQGVEWATCAWVDPAGRPRGKMIALDRLPDAAAGGDLYTPRGLAWLGRSDPAEPEGYTVPDLGRAVRLPTDRRIAWVPSDVHQDGRPFPHCSRSVLRRQVERAAALGYAVNVGMECELYLLRRAEDGGLVPFAASSHLDPTPLYDVRSAIECLPVVDPMVAAMRELGWGFESFDQECGKGQVEFDFSHTDAIGMADRLVLFRHLLAEFARRAGAVACFMPKPFSDGWGSGAHVNFSLADLDSEKNLFDDPDDWRGLGFGPIAYQATAGMLAHAGAIAAVSATTVNSYKRLVPQGALPDITWAPTIVAYGDNNRSCMLRLPRSRRCIEDRVPDIACNPYLAIAMHVAAALDGIERRLDPGEPCLVDVNQVSAGQLERHGLRRLPRTLLEAAEALDADPLAGEVLGPELHRDYVAARLREWEEYHTLVSDWERDRYLNAL